MVNAPSQSKNLFGRRLREARHRAGIAQDKLGVLIGLDEGCSSARMSRYENGIHEPPFVIAEQLAKALGLSASYFYCSDDRLAEIILHYSNLSKKEREAYFPVQANNDVEH
jgi:transcriptional regulator with XRE-family HTH domain